jgi:enoyl-CoA hydratase/carnithine racemase
MIIEERDGRIVTFVMKGENDLNLGVMNDELFDVVERFFVDRDLRCAILTGAGTRAFCAGADLKRVAESGLSGDFWTPRRKSFLDAAGPRKPLVAAVNGHALGAGMMIALACDIRIAAENATFGLPEVKYGFPPVLGATQRLAKLAPLGPTLQMLMTGAAISAVQAERWGLVNEVTPQRDLMPRALAIAREIAGNPPLAVQANRELAGRARDLSLEEGMRLELALSYLARNSEDSKEALRAYLEKRLPVFRGT